MHAHTRTSAHTHTQTNTRTHTHIHITRSRDGGAAEALAVSRGSSAATNHCQSNHGPTRAATLYQAASLVQPTPRLAADIRRKPVFRRRIVIIGHPRSPGRYYANALSLLYWTGPQRWGKGSRATQSFLHLRLWLADFLRSFFGVDGWEGEKSGASMAAGVLREKIKNTQEVHKNILFSD